MNWQDGEFKNPLSGKILRRDTAHSLSDGANRFPMIEEIPYLRAGRDALVRQVVQKLDNGREREALILLLQDQDDWSRSAPPAANDLERLFDNKDLTLREAMRILNYGAVADYFAYRWSDPTFLSGLKLLAEYLPQATKSILELACGIGHFLREFVQHGIQATGADVVFSKLWLARRFVAPCAKLVCFDANYNFPFAGRQTFDAAFCHDAFYFMPEKTHVACELKKITSGAILVGHAHNRDAENYSSGAAIPVAEYAAMFENAVFYDDAELTKAFVENRAPYQSKVSGLKKVEAVSFAANAVMNKPKVKFGKEDRGEKLRINPLLLNLENKVLNVPQYPSKRYENEYAALSAYLNLSDGEATRLRNFPAQNLHDAEIEDFTRRRILLDLPEKW